MCVDEVRGILLREVGRWLESDDCGRNKFLIFIDGFHLHEHVFGVERGAPFEPFGHLWTCL